LCQAEKPTVSERVSTKKKDEPLPSGRKKEKERVGKLRDEEGGRNSYEYKRQKALRRQLEKRERSISAGREAHRTEKRKPTIDEETQNPLRSPC